MIYLLLSKLADKIKKFWWIGLIGVIILISVLASKDMFLRWQARNKFEVTEVVPVDYSIDKDRMSCILRRTPKKITEFCTVEFKPQSKRLNCIFSTTPNKLIDFCTEAFKKE